MAVASPPAGSPTRGPASDRAAAPALSTRIAVEAKRIVAARESHRLAFAIVDKRRGQLAVFNAKGRVLGVTAALVGAAAGDRVHPDAVRKLAQPGGLPLDERTTPGGRYAALPGTNLRGERVIWIDYANALAIHRLRPAPVHEQRAERLASPTPDDNRITLGCVVVDPMFFDAVVMPALGQAGALVVVLHDDETAAEGLRSRAF